MITKLQPHFKNRRTFLADESMSGRLSEVGEPHPAVPARRVRLREAVIDQQ